RSNQRHDIQLITREVSSPIDGSTFPELQWIARRNQRTIIFCHSIGLGNRVHQYLYTCDKDRGGDPETVRKRIREYNAIEESYNAETRSLLQSGECTIVVATSSLAVGVDVEDVENVVIFGDPEDIDQLLQMVGRIRRRYHTENDQETYQGIVYFNANARKRATETLKTSLDSRSSNNTSETAGMDEGLARLYTAKCKVTCIDELYENPQTDEPCTCPTCVQSPPAIRKSPCSCSGCKLKLFIPNPIPQSTHSTHDTLEKPKKHQRISLAMRAHGSNELKKFREQIYEAADDSAVHMLPSELFFADDQIKQVLDNFTQLNEADDVMRLLQGMKNKYLEPYHRQLYTRLQDMKGEFQSIEADKKRQK
ncbi:hypothetical protein F5880DRAFT_1445447, partial [Lentinula raphanica]